MLIDVHVETCRLGLEKKDRLAHDRQPRSCGRSTCLSLVVFPMWSSPPTQELITLPARKPLKTYHAALSLLLC